MVRNYNYPTAVFFSFVYRFLQDFIKVDNDDDDYYYHYHYYESPLKTAITYYYGSTNVRMLTVKIKSLGSAANRNQPQHRLKFVVTITQ